MAYYGKNYSQQLTQKEKNYLQDALQMENLALTKYSVYADQCQDNELKNLLFNISKNKRQHADRLKQLTGQSIEQYQ
ncbi:ferritin-like domain-containing protein [Sporomusa sp.]|uniref:ferritin-like domain-containing protein n=1 Tax=Sporomusa sp. TaxID=2078658 RepID=UPI002CA91B79|nr:ferritin-like domain-containing protein [Sporomusa sp.]HWR45600.1 ferritin-like domain-containing protein [Sporomusa sp.]